MAQLDESTVAMKLSKQLSDLLGQKISFLEVLDELLLIRTGDKPSNKALSEHIRAALQ